MSDLTPTPHQAAALDWIITRAHTGVPLLALRGLAGTGKSAMLPILCAALTTPDHPVLAGAPTHRAAHILRQKGLMDADTLHALCLRPRFTEAYAAAMHWLEREGAGAMPQPIPTLFPAWEGERLWTQRRHYTYTSLLASLGIHARDHFVGWEPRAQPGTLILDEASMVGTELLRLCQQAFRQVILVGDPGQLPPVQDSAVLDTVEGVQLTEVIRQTHGSPLLDLAYKAREGYPFWQHGVGRYAPDVQSVASLPAALLRETPLIVWRNATRLACTKAIRTVLGYPTDILVPGEPLICRSTSAKDRLDGLYNNAQFVVDSVSPWDTRQVTLRDPVSGDVQDVQLHVEEWDAPPIARDAVLFRLGYCLTAHTAQGGEWPTVVLSAPELRAHAGFCWHQGEVDTSARWAYTACTRAQERIFLLTQHHFVGRKETQP